jgi:nitrate reductase gamma subunit
MHISRKQWLRWAGAVFAAQVAVFTYIHFFMIGAPNWAEIPYAPFQDVFISFLGGLGLVLGVIVGTLVYSGVIGLILAWFFRRRTS